MNLRLPVVLSIVVAGAAAAALRSWHPAVSGPPAFATDPSAEPGRTPVARVRPSPDPRVVVYVAGAVAHGGVYRLAPSARAGDAVRAAGGATAGADLVAVNLAARLADGDEVVVPEKGSADDVGPQTSSSASTHRKKRHRKRGRKHRRHRHATAPAPQDAAGAVDPTTTAADDPGPTASVELNAAGASELETLPGIGAELADRIVTFRELNGPYAAADDLLDVGGMTQKRLDAIEPFLVI